MNDDVVRVAARALKAQVSGENDRSQITRARLLATARQSNQSRRRALMMSLPLAAVFVASGLWAAARGGLASGSWDVVDSITKPAPEAARRAAISMSSLAAALQRQAAEPSATPKGVSAGSSSGDGVVRGDEEVPRVAAATSVSQNDAGDAEHASYLVAHRVHFGGGSPSAALQAWDLYLREFPAGKFGLEARYNRALCLVKLGQNSEASRALEPFARGAYRGYRQREALELLDALGGK